MSKNVQTAKVTVTASAPNVAVRPTPTQSAVQGAAAVTEKAAPVARTPAFPDTAKITVVSEANPKRPGTKAHTKWGFYASAKTVADVTAAFVKAGMPKRKAMSALRWDSGHGFIKIEL